MSPTIDTAHSSVWSTHGSNLVSPVLSSWPKIRRKIYWIRWGGLELGVNLRELFVFILLIFLKINEKSRNCCSFL